TRRPMGAIHPTAIVDRRAELAEDVEIGPYCVVEAVRIGRGTRLLAHVVVQGPCTIGEANVVHPFAVLGGAPQAKKHGGGPARTGAQRRRLASARSVGRVDRGARTRVPRSLLEADDARGGHRARRSDRSVRRCALQSVVILSEAKDLAKGSFASLRMTEALSA